MGTTLNEKEETIGERIRQLRTAKGWSIDHLARETGLAKNTVWEAEARPGRKPWFQTLEPLARVFDVPVLWLQTGTMPVEEETLDSYTPELFGRAKGLTDPAHIAEWSTHFRILKRVEEEAAKGPEAPRGLESYSVEEFAHAHGLTDEKRIARVREELETQIRLERLDALEASAAMEPEGAIPAPTGSVPHE